jgi:hypothetical protein
LLCPPSLTAIACLPRSRFALWCRQADMVKHNNVIPNAHFHKEWKNRVKTWFDQVGA